MTAGRYDFTIEKGATFTRTLTWRDSSNALVNLTGYTARMQIRQKAAAANVILELTTENGGISLGGAAGTITLSVAAAATSSLPAEVGVYDLELVSGSVVTRLLEGAITFKSQVTR